MPTQMAPDAAAAFSYAIQFAFTAETYEVHSWMLLLALLRDEKGVSAQALSDLGLTDTYGAWHEVLWALNAAEGLAPRAFTSQMRWARRARRVADGSLRFAAMAGRSKVKAHDLLMALAASEAVLPALFPDLDMSFDSVRRAVEKRSGDKYVLPEEGVEDVLASKDDIFA
jgi:ATP-dependent Clp protease ATP-binding subunit ClpA